MGELAGEGSVAVAVAVGVSDKRHLTPDLVFLLAVLSAYVERLVTPVCGF